MGELLHNKFRFIFFLNRYYLDVILIFFPLKVNEIFNKYFNSYTKYLKYYYVYLPELRN